MYLRRDAPERMFINFEWPGLARPGRGGAADPPNFGFIGFPCVLLTFIGLILVLLVLTMVLQ